jgi:hypothetical protein
MATDLSIAGQWATVAGGVVAAAIILRFVYKAWRVLERVADQVTPNGGDSDKVGDRVQRMEDLLRDHVRADEKVQNQILYHLLESKKPVSVRKRIAGGK